jgi:hypothetical protein
MAGGNPKENIMAAITVTKPARSHKSKKEQAKKSSVRIINDGFVERTKKPVVTGAELKSRMVRIDAEFADWMREQAKLAGISITEVSRSVYQSLTD